jgi:hypothetical protein
MAQKANDVSRISGTSLSRHQYLELGEKDVSYHAVLIGEQVDKEVSGSQWHVASSKLEP